LSLKKVFRAGGWEEKKTPNKYLKSYLHKTLL